MPFTMPNFPLFNKEQSSPYANLLQNALATKGQNIQTNYLPRTLEADIFSKQFAPLAQIASSPLALAMLPQQQQQMATMISQLLNQNQLSQSGMSGQESNSNMIPTNSPSPNNMGSINKSSTTPFPYQMTNNSNPNYNPAIPGAGTNLGNKVKEKTLGTYDEQVHGAGVTFYDPKTNKFYSQPSANTISINQSSINAIKRVVPQLNDITDGAKEFLKPGSSFDILKSSLSGMGIQLGLLSPETAKKFGIDPEKFSRYQGWETKIRNVAESLMSSYPNLPASDFNLSNFIKNVTPKFGETDEGYRSRIAQYAGYLSGAHLSGLQEGLNPIPISPGNNENQNNFTQQLQNSLPAQNEGMAQVKVDNEGKGQVIEDVQKVGKKTLIKVNGQWYQQ